MANTQIHISSPVPGTFTVTVGASFNAGDTVTFTSAPGTDAALVCLSKNAHNALSPDPGSSIPLAAGASVTLTVSAASDGCSAIVVPVANGASIVDADGLPQGVLLISVPGQRPAPPNPMQG